MKIAVMEAIRLTAVSWAASFAETSAKLPLMAWCWVIAALVAPPKEMRIQ